MPRYPYFMYPSTARRLLALSRSRRIEVLIERHLVQLRAELRTGGAHG